MSHVAWMCGAPGEWFICMRKCVMSRIIEACRMYQKNESCRMCECLALQVNESCEYECVFCRVWMSCITSTKWMSHVACMNMCIFIAPSECVMWMNVWCHTWMSLVTSRDTWHICHETCHETHKHTSRHGTHQGATRETHSRVLLRAWVYSFYIE